MGNTMGRVMGLDLGDARIGVAASDLLGLTAQPRETIHCKDRDQAVRIVADVVRSEQAVRVVAGLPLTESGEEGEQAAKVRAFVAELEKAIGVPIETIDERLSSAQAQHAMADHGVKAKKRKGLVDQLAAQHILQTWLDRQSARRPPL